MAATGLPFTEVRYRLPPRFSASDIATPSTLLVTVFNPFAVGGGLTSNAVPLTVSTAPSPTLISVSPDFTAQGADHVSMTLVGANFRPGATVILSPPLAAVSDSNGHTRPTDLTVFSVTVVNSGLMTAVFSASPAAIVSLRAVDVLNLDGTSTAGSPAAGARNFATSLAPVVELPWRSALGLE